jgi:hypothetical protein
MWKATPPYLICKNALKTPVKVQNLKTTFEIDGAF